MDAWQSPSSIEAAIPASELAEAVLSGTIVILKSVFDPVEMRRLRSLIHSANLPVHEPSFDNDSHSWRDHREVWFNPGVEVLFEASFCAVTNPDDEVGRAVRPVAERLATFWRSLTGYDHTLVPERGRRALRPWAMHYPAGGGCFGWHEHQLEFTKISPILALSQIGADFRCGGTEFKTPFGVVNIEAHHDIGDICLFRFDLPHRVTVVDPEQEPLWNGSGRWVLVIQGDPRPPEDPVR